MAIEKIPLGQLAADLYLHESKNADTGLVYQRQCWLTIGGVQITVDEDTFWRLRRLQPSPFVETE